MGDFLPTEQELVQSYQVSRDTIRKALTLLVEEGLVKKIHGSGSQVINQEQINFPVSDLTSLPGANRTTRPLIRKQPLFLWIKSLLIQNSQKELVFSNSQQVWRVVRQRVVDSCASVIDIDYLDAALFRN